MRANRASGMACDRQTTAIQTRDWSQGRPRDLRGPRPSLGVKQRIVLLRGVWIGVILAAFLLTGFGYQPRAVLHTNPQAAQLKVGDTTTIDLMLSDVQGLYGAEIHLRFDPDALQVIDAAPDTEGVQLEPGTFPVPDFVVQNEVDNDTGTIDYAVTQLPPSEPGQGSGVIARITFKALKRSVSLIQFERFLLADTIGGNIDALPQDGQIKVQSRSLWMLYATAGATLTLALGSIGYLVTRRK